MDTTLLIAIVGVAGTLLASITAGLVALHQARIAKEAELRRAILEASLTLGRHDWQQARDRVEAIARRGKQPPAMPPQHVYMQHAYEFLWLLERGAINDENIDKIHARTRATTEALKRHSPSQR